MYGKQIGAERTCEAVDGSVRWIGDLRRSKGLNLLERKEANKKEMEPTMAGNSARGEVCVALFWRGASGLGACMVVYNGKRWECVWFRERSWQWRSEKIKGPHNDSINHSSWQISHTHNKATHLSLHNQHGIMSIAPTPILVIKPPRRSFRLMITTPFYESNGHMVYSSSFDHVFLYNYFWSTSIGLRRTITVWVVDGGTRDGWSTTE